MQKRRTPNNHCLGVGFLRYDAALFFKMLKFVFRVSNRNAPLRRNALTRHATKENMRLQQLRTVGIMRFTRSSARL